MTTTRQPASPSKGSKASIDKTRYDMSKSIAGLGPIQWKGKEIRISVYPLEERKNDPLTRIYCGLPFNLQHMEMVLEIGLGDITKTIRWQDFPPGEKVHLEFYEEEFGPNVRSGTAPKPSVKLQTITTGPASSSEQIESLLATLSIAPIPSQPPKQEEELFQGELLGPKLPIVSQLNEILGVPNLVAKIGQDFFSREIVISFDRSILGYGSYEDKIKEKLLPNIVDAKFPTLGPLFISVKSSEQFLKNVQTALTKKETSSSSMRSGNSISAILGGQPNRPVEIKKLNTGGKDLADTRVLDSSFGKLTIKTFSADSSSNELGKIMKMLEKKRHTTTAIHKQLSTDKTSVSNQQIPKLTAAPIVPTTMTTTETIQGPVVISDGNLESLLSTLTIGNQAQIKRTESLPQATMPILPLLSDAPITMISKAKGGKEKFLEAYDARKKTGTLASSSVIFKPSDLKRGEVLSKEDLEKILGHSNLITDVDEDLDENFAFKVTITFNMSAQKSLYETIVKEKWLAGITGIEIASSGSLCIPLAAYSKFIENIKAALQETEKPTVKFV